MATQYLTVAEISVETGASKDNVLAWIARGELRAINMAAAGNGKPRWRISRAALTAFIASREAGARETAAAH